MPFLGEKAFTYQKRAFGPQSRQGLVQGTPTTVLHATSDCPSHVYLIQAFLENIQPSNFILEIAM